MKNMRILKNFEKYEKYEKFEKGVISIYQISFILPSVAKRCTKACAICNFLSVGMQERRFYATKIIIVCFKIS